MKHHLIPEPWEPGFRDNGRGRPTRDRRGHDDSRRGGPRGRRGAGAFGGPDDGFGPGRRPGRSRARRGDVRNAVLSLLAEAPTNGYGLIKAISERSEGVWRPSPGSVYPTLQQLVDEGLIRPAGSEGSSTDYELTDEGGEYVEAHAETLARVWSPTSDAFSDRAPLVASSRKLSAVLRQVGVVGTRDQRQRAVEKVDELRRELYRMLGEE
jgi:DNA-binding PadR family transcriptional regulator